MGHNTQQSRRFSTGMKIMASATLSVLLVRSGNMIMTATGFVPRTSSSANNAASNTVKKAFGRRSPFSTSSIIRKSTATAVEEDLQKAMTVTHPSYDVISRDIVSEYGSYCTLFKHKETGAELLSVSTDDDNKVFGVTFRTPPDDSTGVPHILEHSVLCGSRKFKTKDPFVRLMQGSLNTFLNAMTYPDRTCYIVASQNTKDFYNLVNVYADAVFYPRAVSDPSVHAQEGWHLELEKKDDPLVYKGVVFNEMKGVYSSADSRLYRAAQQSIFPDNTYGVDSGGDPVVIPDLSFEQFAEFHAKYYHPANSRIYFSGDDDVMKRLELMDEYLTGMGASPESKPGSTIKWQKKKFTEPKKIREPYPVGPDQPDTHMVQVNWLLNDERMSAHDELALAILDHLLMGTPSSFLYKSLIESGLGSSITGGGLMDDLLQAIFGVGLKGVKPEDADKVEELIVSTLEKAAEEGFTDDAIAASMNTIEFQLREFNTGSYPKGLAWMLGSMSKWIYDESPTEALKFEEPLAQLKKSIEESGSEVFQKLIKDLILNNTHRATVEMLPSKTLEEEQLNAEKEKLASIKASLSDDELDQIIKSTAELKAKQASEDTVEDIATIPSLSLEDLERTQAEYPNDVTEDYNGTGVTMVSHEFGSTSGIAYIDLGVDLSSLPLADIPLLPLFSRLMKEAGAGEYSDVGLSRYIGTYTGGVSVSMIMDAVRGEGADEFAVYEGSHMVSKMFIRGKATTDNVDKLFDIYRLMLTDAKLDSQKKVIEMLKESKSRIESSIQGSGHAFANSRMKARYLPTAYISEKIDGISYLETVKGLLEQAENNWPVLLTRLENVRNTLLNDKKCRKGMILNVTGDKKVMEDIKPSVDKFLSELPGDCDGDALPNFYVEEHSWIKEARAEMREQDLVKDEGFVVPTQVSYVGKGGRVFEAGEKWTGASAVVARYLRTGYLWDHVRVIGGAYGGFCTFDARTGVFTFLSYRDPNLDKTLDVYDAAADALIAAAEDLENRPEELATAIIGTIGDMDGALSNDGKGWKAFNRWLLNESAEKRHKLRQEVLNTKPSDFKDFAEKLKALKDTSVAVISSKAAFESAAEAGKVMELKVVV